MQEVTADLNNPDTRREALLAQLSRSGRLVAAELADVFSVSGDTIRRDLLALERDGSLRRVRGGALPVSRPGRPFHERCREAGDEAVRLANAAASLVETGMCVMLDGGTSILACMRALPADRALTVITPSPAVAVAAQASGHEVIVIGGRLGESGGSAVGADTERAIACCSADLCLLGACTMDLEQGVGADDHDDASVKRAMISASVRVAVVAGASKFGKRSRFQVVAPEGLDVIVSNAPDDVLSSFRNHRIDIVGV